MTGALRWWAWRLPACYCIGFAALGSSAEAAESIRLPGLVVVATGHERGVADTPATVHALDLGRLHLERQPRTLADALAGLPGIMLQKTGHGMTSPYLRGQTGQRVLMMADGVRLNTAILRDGPNQYWNLLGTYLYEDLDVLLGPASVLYGSDAIGGVVLARTRPLRQGDAGAGWQWEGGEAIGRWASAERSFSEAVTANLSWSDSFGLRLALERQDFGELRTGGATDNPGTDYGQWGANLRAAWWLDARQSLHLGYDRYDQDDIDRVHKTVDYVPWHGTTGGSDGRRVFDHDRQAAFLRYELHDGERLLEGIDAGISWQQILQRYRRYRTSGAIRADQPTRVDAFGSWLKLTSPSSFGTWTYGADAWVDLVDSWDGLEPNAQGEFGDNSTYQMLGLSVQNELPLGGGLELISALRYSYVNLEARRVADYGDMRGHWDAVVASARLAWHPGERSVLYAGLAQGFRAPNLADCARLGEYASGSFEAPAGELAEEHYLTYQAGFRNRGDWGQVSVAVYYTTIQDQIGRLTLDGEATKRNLDEGHLQGAELQAEAELGGGMAVFGSVGWQQGSEQTYRDQEITLGSTERYLSRTAPLGGELGLRWRSPDERLWAETVLRWAGRQDKLSDSDLADTQRIPPGGTPGYGVVDLRAGWNLDDRTTLVVAVENVADKDYRIHGSGVNEPGLNVVATLRHAF